MTYKRSQIEDAICRSTVSTGAARSKILVRIKRLLDIDRVLKRSRNPKGKQSGQYAFFSAEPPGRGQEVSFQEYEAFALNLALQFLDQGLPQHDVVEILRSMRPALELEHQSILAKPLAHFMDTKKAVREPSETIFSEDPVFVAIGKSSNPKSPRSSNGFTAEILHGGDGWWNHLWSARGRSVTTAEITLTAHVLNSQLVAAKPRKKGRP